MNSDPRLFSFRIEPAVEAALTKLAADANLTKPMMLEKLILDASVGKGFIKRNDPAVILWQLFDWIKYESGVVENQDYTRDVFAKIQSTPKALRFWEDATKHNPGERPEKRRQQINSRIGRFCKRLIDWESGPEVTLAKTAGMLIKGYTRLEPR